ncbi:MAG: TauD/TfdA family dioxygenase [Bdellovibrionales bacterium]|nr:TauD/TfdA family dioxygenase [Bdellovibrionales bacterium]
MNWNNELSKIKQEFFDHGFVKRNLGALDKKTFTQVAESLGKLLPIGRHNVTGSRYIQNVSEDGLFKRDEVPWHNDFSYSVGDYDGTILMMRSFENRVPTYFSDTKAIYQSLPDLQKEEYSLIQCSYLAPAHYHDLLSKTQLKVVLKNLVSKPLIIKHPVSGQKCLYFSPATLHKSTRPFDLENLVSIAEEIKQPMFYENNDILIFDNLRWMHKRPSFEGHRQLWRISFSYVH